MYYLKSKQRVVGKQTGSKSLATQADLEMVTVNF